MNNITDYLNQLNKLTYQNLEILKAINDSFFTKNNHISVKIGETNYAMPSFISLENKINILQESFHNLVNAPSTGEAYFNMDGNSRVIEVRGYTHTPNSVKIDKVYKFNSLQNNIFKDFLTPVPYININLSNLPNDITSVNIKKIIPIHPELVDKFKSFLGEDTSFQYTWADLYKILSLYKKNIDFTEYNSVKKLPIRENIGSGVYVIDTIIKDYIDQMTPGLDNYITLKIRNDMGDQYMNNLAYKLFDETIWRPLTVGDQLVTYDDSAKLEIVDLDPSTNTMTLKVLNGEYLNLNQTSMFPNINPDNIDDLCKLKFYSPIDFDKDKYINIPLEEDQYIFTAIAPLNDRMNIQSPWGSGLFLNTYKLKLSNDDNVNFEDYYKNNVRNIGDILFEITSAMSNTVTSLPLVDYKKITGEKPVINLDNIEVIQINNHLNDSEVVKNIRSLYSQKNLYKTELNEWQIKIDNINKNLASISFDDTSGVRSSYNAQLTEYNNKKNELITSISKVVDEISLAANNSKVPIENAKYRIRGFFDYSEFAKKIGNAAINHIKGIQVQYRYKNIDQPQGNAQSINEGFLFSDWNIMDSFLNPKYSIYDNGFKFVNTPDNSKSNEPSFNQIDIPISQGETVDIKLKVIYDYGYPFIETSSEWSDIANINFPEEYLKNIQILDIISENNNDIETNRFKNILKDVGIPNHIDDKIVDQDLVYFHRPENISSGFYTNERRIIPLKDKLSELSNNIISLQDEIQGTSAEAISVSIANGDISNKLLPFQTNNIGVESYDVFANQNPDKPVSDGIYIYDPKTGVVSTTLNIIISNTSKHIIKLYSMFPGGRDNNIGQLLKSNVKFNQEDYESKDDEQNPLGVLLKYDDKDDKTEHFKLQSANQFITFRINDTFNGAEYYSDSADEETENKLPFDKQILQKPFEDKLGLIMYPNIREKFALCLNNDNIKSYLQISPNEDIIIPIYVSYKLRHTDERKLSAISKIMTFDIRTSLYNDPINYTFKVTAKLNNSTQDKLITSNRKYITDVDYKTIVTK